MPSKIVVALLCAFLWLTNVASAQGQSGDPSDYFLNGYTAYQRGEKLESGNNTQGALEAYKEAANLLDQIAARWPTWNPTIVSFRKDNTLKSIARCQSKLAGTTSADVEPTIPKALTGGSRTEKPDDDDGGVLPEGAIKPAPPTPKTGKGSGARKIAEEGESRDPLGAAQKQFEKLQRDLQDTQGELATLQEQKSKGDKELKAALDSKKKISDELEVVKNRADMVEKAMADAKGKGLQDAKKMEEMRADLSKQKGEISRLQIEEEARGMVVTQTADALKRALSRSGTFKSERDKAQAEVKDVDRKVAEAVKGEKKRADDAEANLKTAVVEVQKRADAAVEKAQTQIKLVMKERDDLGAKLTMMTKERDDLKTEVGKLRESQKQVDKLVNDNTRLMAQLSTAEKQINEFKVEGTKKDQLIVTLTSEVKAVKEQLVTTQKESASYQTRMADLQAKLDLTKKDLETSKTTGVASEAEKKKMVSENEILRNIVQRQMKDGARRDQTRKLVLTEMEKLNIKSKDLLERINYLGQPTLVLTAAERKLFKPGKVEISEDSFSTVIAEPTRAAEPAVISAPLASAGGNAELGSATSQPLPLAPPMPEKSGNASVTPAPPVATPAPVKTTNAATPAPMKIANAATPALTKATPAAAKPVATPEAARITAPDKTTLAKNTVTEKPALTLSPSTAESLSPLPESGVPNPPAGSSPALPGSNNADSTAVPLTSDSSRPAPGMKPELLPLVQEGKDQFERGNYRDAEKTYGKILDRDPVNLYALSNRGVVQYRLQKYKLAEESFKKAIAIAPEDGFSHCTLGIVYYVQAKYDDAMNSLTKALAINPKNPIAHNYLGITASQKGWPDSAQKELETATALDPNYADAWFNLSVVFATRQPSDKENARRCYKKAVELGAESDSSLEQLIK